VPGQTNWVFECADQLTRVSSQKGYTAVKIWVKGAGCGVGHVLAVRSSSQFSFGTFTAWLVRAPGSWRPSTDFKIISLGSCEDADTLRLLLSIDHGPASPQTWIAARQVHSRGQWAGL